MISYARNCTGLIGLILCAVFLWSLLGIRLIHADDSLGISNRDKSPNIIFILADDLGYGDLSSTGQKYFKTPNLDRMAEQGMFFSQHYSGSTVCAPSRSCLITGQHTGHTPIRGNKEILPEGQHPLPEAAPSLPITLSKAGYVTGAFGKWGLGFPGSEGDPMKHFDRFYGYNCQRIGHHYYPHAIWDNDQQVELAPNAGSAKGVYAPTLIHDQTLQFIEDNRDRRFFCYVPTVIPHAELAAPEAYMKQFRGAIEEGLPYEGYDEGVDFRNGPYQSQPEPRVAFAAMVSLLDQQVGEILDLLEKLGISDNTLVVFSSDNGPHQEGGADPEFFRSNAGFRGYKRDLYEGGIRVPLIVCWPGEIENGSRSDHISAFWDFLPTFAEIVGEVVPEGIDGISLLPTLLGEDDKQIKHDYLYWEFHERGGRIALRQGDWKAVKYDVLENPDRPAELYNLVADPGEKVNLANSYPEILSRLESLMKSARTESDVFTFQHKQYNAEK
ncbi:arylsulfatase [Puniceicoccaceae bacterium K14]|nr:arylsulfatase [Puniceicoccaceae bacterium K14]